jgi:hypothetical protein
VKEEILDQLVGFRDRLRALRKSVAALPTNTVNRVELRKEADALATEWVERLRSPLEHKFKLASALIKETSEAMKRLHVISRPSNLRTSYFVVIDSVVKKFDDRFLLPIKQMSIEVSTIFDLAKLVPSISDQAESEYMHEAIDCANAGYRRAAVVVGWCAAVDRMQRRILAAGLQRFNDASTTLKNKTTGKFAKWNKEFKVTTLGELQTVFDTDLLTVLEGMELLDGNQAERLRTCFQYRNHSAHPGEAPVEDPHLIAFFTDIASIILRNPKFAVAG